MILLIGGATGVGSSTIAMELGMRLPARSVIGTDSIREIIRRVAPKDLYLPISQSTYNQYEAVRILNENFLALKEKEKVIAGYKMQTEVVNVGIAAIIERALVERINLIIEGIHISPEFIDETYISKVLFLLIDIKDPEEHRRRIKRREKSYPERVVGKHLSYFPQIRIIRDYMIKTAKKFGIPIIENKDLESTVEKCWEEIKKELASR